jgi:hypothetical protein
MDEHLNDYLPALKDIFVGGELQQPQQSWIVAVEEPFLDIYGEDVCSENDTLRLDFKDVIPRQREQRTVSIQNVTQQPVLVTVNKTDADIAAVWKNNSFDIHLEPAGTEELKISFNGNSFDEKVIEQAVSLVSEMETGGSKEFLLQVRVQPVPTFPQAEFKLNSSSRLSAYDFGTMDPMAGGLEVIEPCRLSVKNTGTGQLKCSLGSLPGWLAAEINDRSIDELNPEFFVEAEEETIVNFRPVETLEFPGKQKSYIRLETNDIRPADGNINIQFLITLDIVEAYVTLENEPTIELLHGKIDKVPVQLLNWGGKPARIKLDDPSGVVTLEEEIDIPAAINGSPQKMVLPLVVDGKLLKPGDYRYNVILTIPGSSREQLEVPLSVTIIWIDIQPPQIDFGIVDLERENVVTLTFQASDGRDLVLEVAAVNDLKDYLELKQPGSDTIDVHFRNMNPGLVKPQYKGDGIDVHERGMDFHSNIPVSYTIAKPGIKIEPQPLNVMGSGSRKVKESFKIHNPGNGVLKVTLDPKHDWLKIVGETKIEIEPGVEKEILFEINHRDIKKSSIRTNINIATNIPGNEFFVLNINLKIKRIAGILCVNCHLVSDVGIPFCSFCGAEVRKAEKISTDRVSVCDECGQVYESAISFCPVDGKQLNKY